MSILQQVTRPVLESESKTWQRQNFRSDDDQYIPVSIWLESSEGENELIGAIASLLQAYGFTIPGKINRAPGSSFFFFMARSEHGPEESLKNRKALEKDLQNQASPKNERRRRAASRLKTTLQKPPKKKTKKIVVIGSMLITAFLTGIGEGVGIYIMEHLKNPPPITQPVKPSLPHKHTNPHKKMGVKPQPPNAQIITVINLNTEDANSCHQTIKQQIDKSPEKTEIEPPPID